MNGVENVQKLDVSQNANLVTFRVVDSNLEEVTFGNLSKLSDLEITDCKVASMDLSGCPLLVAALRGTYVDENALGEEGYKTYTSLDESSEIVVDSSIVLIPTPTATKKTQKSSTKNGGTTVTATAAPAAPAVPTIAAVKKSGKATVSAAPGTTYQLDLGGATGKKFKSSKKKVATVDSNGVVTVKKAGKTKITFKVGKKKRSVTLIVKDPTVPTSIALNMAGNNPVTAGETVTLTATLPEGTTSGIKWKSSNKKIATVNNGVVTFKKKGKVTITATATRGKKKAKVKFTVSK